MTKNFKAIWTPYVMQSQICPAITCCLNWRIWALCSGASELICSSVKLITCWTSAIFWGSTGAGAAATGCWYPGGGTAWVACPVEATTCCKTDGSTRFIINIAWKIAYANCGEVINSCLACSGLLVATALSWEIISTSWLVGYACNVWEMAFGIDTLTGGGFPSGSGGSWLVDRVWN